MEVRKDVVFILATNEGWQCFDKKGIGCLYDFLRSLSMEHIFTCSQCKSAFSNKIRHITWGELLLKLPSVVYLMGSAFTTTRFIQILRGGCSIWGPLVMKDSKIKLTRSSIGNQVSSCVERRKELGVGDTHILFTCFRKFSWALKRFVWLVMTGISSVQ